MMHISIRVRVSARLTTASLILPILYENQIDRFTHILRYVEKEITWSDRIAHQTCPYIKYSSHDFRKAVGYFDSSL